MHLFCPVKLLLRHNSIDSFLGVLVSNSQTPAQYNWGFIRKYGCPLDLAHELVTLRSMANDVIWDNVCHHLVLGPGTGI